MAAVGARRVAILEPALDSGAAASRCAPPPGRRSNRHRAAIASALQHDAGIEMHHAFGAEAEGLLADRDVARIAAVEIFVDALQRRASSRASRKASPMSMFLPDTRNGMDRLRLLSQQRRAGRDARSQPSRMNCRDACQLTYEPPPAAVNAHNDARPDHQAHRGLLVPPALHRGRNPHRLAIFGDRAAGDIDAGAAQNVDDGVVRQHVWTGFPRRSAA